MINYCAKKNNGSARYSNGAISLTSVFGKAVEIVMKQKLYDNFIKNKSLTRIKKMVSVINAPVLNIMSSIVEGLERAEHTAITLCDLSNVFDCITIFFYKS